VNEAKAKYDSAAEQLISKIELLYEVKVQNIKEHISTAKQALATFFTEGKQILDSTSNPESQE